MGNPSAPASWGLADAVADGTFEDPSWVDVLVPADDIILSTPRDALRMPFPQAGGRLMRAPCSYKEQIQVARALGCVSATIEWARAIWATASFKQSPVELVRTAADAEQMGTLAFLIHAEDQRDAQMASATPDPKGGPTWGRGACKGWYVDPMMLEQDPVIGACNWGFVHPNGTPDQTPGGRHNWFQIDYSQPALDLCKRMARKISDGSPVDLLVLQATKFPALAKRITEEYGP